MNKLFNNKFVLDLIVLSIPKVSKFDKFYPQFFFLQILPL